MKFGMLVDCLPQNILSYDTKVDLLVSSRIRLCHLSEMNIFNQVSSIRSEYEQRDTSFINMFSKVKVHHRTPFTPWGSDFIPFYHHRMMGLSNFLSIRIENNAEWSECIDLSKVSIDGGNTSIYLREVTSDGSMRSVDVGLCVEKGKGFFQNISNISLVPRHVLISKLSESIQIRQHGVEDSSYFINLDVGSISIVNHSFSDRPKLLQIRRYQDLKENKNKSSKQEAWCGEIDVSNIGLVYAKLRNPSSIIKIQVEIVGATLVATLSEQNLLWPPYRIDNKTSMPLRVRQSITSSVKSKNLSIPESIERNSLYQTSDSSEASRDQMNDAKDLKTVTFDSNQGDGIPWEQIHSKMSIPYAWDLPRSGGTVLSLEFPQGASHKFLDINFDEVSKSKTFKILRYKGIGHGNPSAEGALKHRESGESWAYTYCILKSDIIYIYKDESRDELVSIVNLHRPLSTLPKEYQSQNPSAQFAKVSKYAPKTAWGDKLLNTFGLPMTSSSYSASLFSTPFKHNLNSSPDEVSKIGVIDPNQARILTLTLAKNLNLLKRVHWSIKSLSALNEDSYSDRISDSDESDNEAQPLPVADDDLKCKDLNVSDDEVTLKSLFSHGKSVDQIIEAISDIPVKGVDILQSLEKAKYAENEKVAIRLMQVMILDGILISVPKQSTSTDSVEVPLVDGSGLSSLLQTGMEDDNFTEIFDSDLVDEVSELELGNGTSTTRDGQLLMDSSPTIGETVKSPIETSLVDNKTFENVSKTGDGKIPLHVHHSLDTIATKSYFRPTLFQTGVSSIGSSMLSPANTQNSSSRCALSKNPSDAHVDILKNEDFYFRLIPLIPEFSSLDVDKGREFTDEGSLVLSLMIGSSKHYFQCSSINEYLGWMQACRHNIENAWVKSIENDQHAESKIVTVDSLYSSMTLRIRADGPTKVLEIFEDVVPNESRATGTVYDSDLMSTFTKEKYITDALSVGIFVQSLALSVVDAEPVEVLHLTFEDIDMNIERMRYLVRMAGTVQAIHVGNQLLNPLYPVALHPIIGSNIPGSDTSGSLQSKGSDLFLPGLQAHDGQRLPSLHLYFQEKYHGGRREQSISNNRSNEESVSKDQQPPVRRLSGSEGDEDSNLIYFDAFTIWLSPMHLDLDEELIIRLLRFAQSLRQVLQKPKHKSHSSKSLPSYIDLPNTIRDDILTNQHLGTRSWGILDSREISVSYNQYLRGIQNTYSFYDPSSRQSKSIFFSLLQLHPIDILVHIRPTPHFQLNTTELALISLISNLDSSRIRLNALVTEHAFGTTSMIMEVVTKHYRAAMWRQVQKLIGGGSMDIVEGSVGLVANLGTGVYDLFYEPVDLVSPSSNSSFFTGLSKGSKSLATTTIGGTSAITSRITGGLGRGVSLLTLDTDFQRLRHSRRLHKANSVSEGIYVGTKELGKNIVDGVTGIYKAPYRGWEEGGGVGLGMGLAKGLLGVALKPAVGVFDLASRATEGLRNSSGIDHAGDSEFSRNYGYDEEGRYIFKKRFPRPFGRLQLILPYNAERAAAQYVADRLAHFKKDPRLHIVHHQHFHRQIVTKIASGSRKPFTQEINNDESIISDEISLSSLSHPPSGHYTANSAELHQDENLGRNVETIVDSSPNASGNPLYSLPSAPYEAWGMRVGQSYIAIVSEERIGLFQVRSSRSSRNGPMDVSFVWSCPAVCISELFSDQRGDLVLHLSQTICMPPKSSIGATTWSQPVPVIMDKQAQDYVIFQLLLEQSIGLALSRAQPMYPRGGLVDTDVYKRLSTGIRSLVYAPTKHTYQLIGHVLYEYTETDSQSGHTDGSSSSNSLKYPSDRYFADSVNKFFGVDTNEFSDKKTVGSNNTNDDTDVTIYPHGYISFVYPLVDVSIMGPFIEDNNRCSISIANKDNSSRMRVLKRDSEDSLFTDYNKTILTLIFSSRGRALVWKQYLEKHKLSSQHDIQDTVDSFTAGNKMLRGLRGVLSSTIGSSVITNDGEEPPDNSIIGMLVIPSSGLSNEDTELLKVEIAKTLTSSRKY